MDDIRARSPESVTSGQCCQVCGAATRSDESLCDSCSRTADTIADTPLPPIPDGGLARAMPAWLRSSPMSIIETTPTPPPAPNEFASILSDEDIPLWLKRMAERHAADQASAAIATDSQEPAAAASPLLPDSFEVAAPLPVPAGRGERRVMVGAPLPRPIDPTLSTENRSPERRLPADENRTVIGVGILAVIAALVILAIVLFD